MKDQELNEEKIDIRNILLRYSTYWYFFLLSILFFIFLGFLVNRYTVPEYSVSSTLLIRDDSNTQLGAENILEGLELFSGKKNLKNEIIILKSYSVTEQIVEELNLGISYFKKGFIISNELFKNSPFTVTIDSTKLQVTGVKYEIDFINKESFKLRLKADDKYAYNVIKEKFDKSKSVNINFKEEYNFGDTITSPLFTFSINKTSFFDIDKIKKENKKFSFKLHPKRQYAQKLIKDININPINKETSILKLSIKGSNPKKNIEILDKLTEIYIRSGLNEKNIMAVNTINFIDNQLNIIEDSLSFIENQLEEFRLENPNLEIVDKEYGTYFQKQKLDNSLSEQSVNIKYYKSLLNYLKDETDINSIVSPTSMGISNPELNNLINQLLLLYSNKGELEITTTKRNPSYQAVLSQIEHTKQTIIENIKNLISSAAIYETDLKNRINLFNSKINKLPEAEKKYIILKRKYQYNEQTAVYLQQKRYEASLAKAGTESDHKVIDAARLDSQRPIKPRKTLTYFIMLIIAFFVPISIISIRRFFNDTINKKSDIKNNSNVPIIGLIGHSDKSTSLVVPNSTKSIITESFRSLRTNIQYIAANKTKKIISVTSSIGGEGKTFVTMNLASIFALSNHKTILIGGDLRKPKLHNSFKLDKNQGLSNYLINKSNLDDIITKTNIKTLDVIASGPIPPNPAELLDSPKMNELLSILNTKYDYVIIDTPPIGLVTDGVIIMQYADANLYIVRHNYSKIKSLSVVNNIFKNKNISNLNIVINDYTENEGYGYGYGYGYGNDGYGYYEKDDE
tara:strand:+ start:10222 stop:12612 length:2391 start_codon:yes stop_codon:yes gene_type:complete